MSIKCFVLYIKSLITAIDHINYHPSQQVTANTTRVKRSSMYIRDRQYHSQTMRLTPSEENWMHF